MGCSSAASGQTNLSADHFRRAEFSDAGELWGLDILRPSPNWMKSTQACSSLALPAKTLSALPTLPLEDRFLGRGGMGAVLGSKNLKAIVALGGTYKINPAETISPLKN